MHLIQGLLQNRRIEFYYYQHSMWVWLLQFLWWIWFFLFWLSYMEQSVSWFSNGWFKNFMKKFTSTSFKSFLSGIFTTTILQSSNVMSILVLAFVWTWILSLTSALAVILWANIWTMIPTSILWIVWLSLDVSMIAFPLIFLWAVCINFLSRWSKIEAIGKFLLSLGLIFLAFSFMKEGLNFLADVDMSIFVWMSPRVFFLFGLLLTLLAQSGSITFVIVLATVWTWILSPTFALPIIFGWYLWSTVTIIIWALGKNSLAIKRQVAIWHVWFNFVTALAGMLCLTFIADFYTSILEPKLWVVVWFTVVRIGWRTIFALLFLPLVNSSSNILKKRVKDKKQDLDLAIQKIFSVEDLDPALAQMAVKQDMFLLFWNAIKYNLNVRDFSPMNVEYSPSTQEELATTLSFRWNFDKNDLSRVYRDVKYIQNQLLEFIVSLPVSEKSTENAELYQSIIATLDSCKTIKDVQNHIEDRQRSSSDSLQKDYEITREMVIRFYSAILHLYQRFDSKKALSDAKDVLSDLQRENDEYLAHLRPHKWDDIPLTALIQTRRYLAESCGDLLHAMELFKVGADEIKYFRENLSKFTK